MGQQNDGWKHVLTTLGFERSGIASVGAVMRTADDLAVYMAERAATGQPVAQAHQDRFADLVAQLHAAARLMGYRVAWMQDQALPDLARSSMVKVLASDLQLYMANLVSRRPGPRRHRPGPRRAPRRPRRAPGPRAASSTPSPAAPWRCSSTPSPSRASASPAAPSVDLTVGLRRPSKPVR